MNYTKLKKLLDSLYLTYSRKFSSKDPVWFLHRFSDKRDIELTGLITASYAYGSVDLINRFIEQFLNRINNKPYEFIINFSKHKDKKYLKGLSYRFYSENDLVILIDSVNRVLLKYGSLYNLFQNGYENSHLNILKALEHFSRCLNGNIMTGKSNGKSYHHYMVSNPANGSTCKRMNLYLRWMVRKDEIDTGIWSTIPASKLVMPVDVHIARAAKKLKLVKRKSIDIKFAVELTEHLRKFDSNDPVKYDFSLCHIGIDKKHILSEVKALLG